MRIFLGRLPFPAQNWHFLQPNAGCRCSQGAEDSRRTSSRWGGTNMPWGGRMKNVSHRVGHPLDLPVFTDSYRSELATHYEIYKAWTWMIWPSPRFRMFQSIILSLEPSWILSRRIYISKNSQQNVQRINVWVVDFISFDPAHFSLTNESYTMYMPLHSTIPICFAPWTPQIPNSVWPQWVMFVGLVLPFYPIHIHIIIIKYTIP